MGDRVAACAQCWNLPVVANRSPGGRYRELVLRAPELAARMRPGQFVNVRCAEGLDPFLRRPFSVYRMDRAGGTFSLLYDVVGRGTGMMARWEPGDAADVLAPLGNWFAVPDGGGPLALVAGGVGVVPLVALAEAVAPTGRPLHALLGARTADLLLGEADFRGLGATVDVSTDDGSRDHHGPVHSLLQALLDRGDRFDVVYACGPRAMMAAVSRVAEGAGLPCFVSMEAGMACGFGVCMGCAWRVRADEVKYRLVCTDGPIFDAREILWDMA
ncbi:MAG: dihydroorotate dehydrogenase electron transfer subunit [Armatimonadetes bacterium]|nr:dihydroorotate dehydrogenase electron transfer subunit [Armatimonadota bacterium]